MQERGLDRFCTMQAAVEGSQSVYLELARYLAPGTDALIDPAFETYHGVAAIPMAGHLSEPGQTETNLQAVVAMAYLEAQQAGTLPQPGLPRPDVPTNSKVYQTAFACIVHTLLFAEAHKIPNLPLLPVLRCLLPVTCSPAACTG